MAKAHNVELIAQYLKEQLCRELFEHPARIKQSKLPVVKGKQAAWMQKSEPEAIPAEEGLEPSQSLIMFPRNADIDASRASYAPVLYEGKEARLGSCKASL